MTKPSTKNALGGLPLAPALGPFAAAPARAGMSAEELAKIAQNPVDKLISVPFQNNTNFNVGPRSGTQSVLNIQPVVPIEIDKDWNIITRTILPVISQPAFTPFGDRTNGIVALLEYRYDAPFKFTGKLDKLTFKLEPLTPEHPGPGSPHRQ